MRDVRIVTVTKKFSYDSFRYRCCNAIKVKKQGPFSRFFEMPSSNHGDKALVTLLKADQAWSLVKAELRKSEVVH